jgi:uncharacterized membrane protein
MRAHIGRRFAVILLAPVLFWILATSVEIAKRDPEAFETPLAYLAMTWLLYLPVFGVAGVLLIAMRRFVPSRSRLAPWVGAVAGAGLAVVALSIAAVAYSLPMRAWRLCLIVGAVIGAILLRIGPSDSPPAGSIDQAGGH